MGRQYNPLVEIIDKLFNFKILAFELFLGLHFGSLIFARQNFAIGVDLQVHDFFFFFFEILDDTPPLTILLYNISRLRLLYMQHIFLPDNMDEIKLILLRS